MPEVKDFNNVLVFADSVINKYRAMLQFSHAGALSNSAAYARKPGKQIHMVE